MKTPPPLIAAFVGMAVSGAGVAQDFPGNKAINFVVPFAAGGPTDRLARDLAEAMRKPLHGTSIGVENVPGAGGTTGATKVARAKNDGYTLLVWHIGLAAAPALYRKLPFKPLEDFEFLGLVSETPMTLLGKPQLPVSTYRDFEAHVKANGDKLYLAHAGLGSASHICGLMWQAAAKLNAPLSAIPFGGTAPAMDNLISGQVDVMCDQTTNTTGQIEAGRVKAFAVTSAQRLSSHPVLKGYPTLNEMGLKGFGLTIWHGLYAPTGTPEFILKRLNDALKAALKDPEFVKKQVDLGAVVVTDKRKERLHHKAFVATEIDRLRLLIDGAGKFAD